MHPYVHYSVIYNSQDLEAAQVPLSRWVDKRRKKKEILPFAVAWMDLENIMLSEISQSEKDKYHMTSLICRM